MQNPLKPAGDNKANIPIISTALIVMTQGCHGLLHHIEQPKMRIDVPNSPA